MLSAVISPQPTTLAAATVHCVFATAMTAAATSAFTRDPRAGGFISASWTPKPVTRTYSHRSYREHIALS